MIHEDTNMQHAISICAIAFIAGACMTAPASAAEPFVVGPGQKYPTISSALAQMKDGDTCIIKPGVYRECIEVPQNKATLRGQGRVVVTGCDDAGEGSPAMVNGHDCLVFEVEKPVYDAFRGTQYLPQARFPNKTQPMTSNRDWAYATIEANGDVSFSEMGLTVPPDLNDGYYVGVGNFKTWYSLTLPIVGVRENGRIQVDSENASSGYMGPYGKGNGLGYVIGAKAALDAPGEWYSDGKQVWIIPPVDGAGAYELRTRLYGVVIKGNGVRLENIRFHAAAGRVEGDDVSFIRCAFEYISPFRHTPNPKDQPGNKRGQSMACGWGIPENGTAGVYVTGDGFVAEHCRLSKSWWCGLMVRGNRARIENCLFEDMNWMAKRCAALFSWGDDSTVRYCTFRDLGGAGIEGGNGTWIEQYAKRNIWEYNSIEDYCMLIVDQGAFYVNHQRGDHPKSDSVWRYNVAASAHGPKKGNWSRSVAAYYVDNSSSGYHIHNNIAIDVINPMKYNEFQKVARTGKDVWYYNNTFYKCGNAALNARNGADVNVVNCLAVSCPPGALGNKNMLKSYTNNHVLKNKSALVNPDKMDFTPTREDLKSGGVKVLGKAIPYVGAVDPETGMWRYGADESKLPQK